MITFSQVFSQTNVLTVSNDVNSPGMYTLLQDALDFARDNPIVDEYYTILVSGTPNSYGLVIIEVQVTLIGAGYHPNNQFEHPTQISDLWLYGGCTGTTIMGFLISNNIRCEGTATDINEITIKRNKITNYLETSWDTYPNSGWVIVNNIIGNIRASNSLNTSLIDNNIITHTIDNIFAGSAITITNNIFIDYSGGAFYNVYTATISNNIFYGPTPGGADNCTFNNNINVGPEDFIYGSNTGADNLIDTDPMFIDGDNPGDIFDYANDYRLQDPGSPGLLYGTDGTDVGIYGGTFIFPNAGEETPWWTSAMPEIPQIIEMNILTPTVSANGEIIVQVKARKQE